MHDTLTTSPPTRTASSASLLNSVLSSINFPERTASMTSVRSKSECAPVSDRRAQYVESRIERRSKEKGVVREKLGYKRRRLGDDRTCKSKLRDRLTSLEQALSAETKVLEEIDKKIKQLQAESISAQEKAAWHRKDISSLSEQLQHREETIRAQEADIDQLEKELKNATEGEIAKVARQAEILDMSDADLTAMAIHAMKNREFGIKIDKAAQKTATSIMIRDIQSELFSRMTGITPDEFQDLMQQIQSAKNALSSEKKGDKDDGNKDDTEHIKNDRNSVGDPDGEYNDVGKSQESLGGGRDGGEDEDDDFTPPIRRARQSLNEQPPGKPVKCRVQMSDLHKSPFRQHGPVGSQANVDTRQYYGAG
ncbi:hypothetical protein AYO20_00172 [Fonsecaea nubica]|uniref:Uncharacterized protein n=1 Tax=Fonsecaea nubica TaxID=856822 RepID=A0A178DF81_9EURO|nr:hypothetical protein AYO20_00172 [Fonsecaea nubica]OAL40436.1 hypothetical protein AYO20_00172 [Fonsecaea nubica]